MAITGATIETAVFDRMRAAMSAVATTVKLSDTTGAAINAIIASREREDTENIGGVDDAHSGSVHVKKSADTGLPENRRIYVYTGGAYALRRITKRRERAVDAAGTYGIVTYDFESAQRGQA